MLLSDIPALAAHHGPDIVAIHFQDRSITYRQLCERTQRLSTALLDIAMPGDRIAILAENCVEYVDCYYGVPGAGMALTLLNYRLSPRELIYIIGDSEPSVLIVEPKYLPTIQQIRDDIPSVRQIVLIGGEVAGCLNYDTLLSRGAADVSVARPSEDSLCWLLYTSGTTGLPKGAMLSHRNLLAAMYNSMTTWETLANEVSLFNFPMFHVAGYSMPMSHLRNHSVVLLRSFDVESLLQSVEKKPGHRHRDGANHGGNAA